MTDPRRTIFISVLLAGVVTGSAVAQTASPPAQPPAKPWWERLTFFGDFRARYEGFFQDERETRQRERMRLRVGLRTNITDRVGFGLRLASGASNDVASTNQSFEDFLSRKPINIDQVFLTWSPAALKGLTLGYGKYGYPLMRTQLVWDDDKNWEGTYEQYSRPLGQNATLRLAAAQSPLDEVSGGEDAFLFAEQVQVGVTAGRHQAQLAVSSYSYRDVDQVARAVAAGQLLQNANLLLRNAAGAVTGYASRFHVIDVIGQGTLATAAASYPVSLLAEWCTNTRAATDADQAVWLVAGIGRAATPGTAALTYTFTRVEQESVLSAFSFSDMPFANFRAHMIVGSYMPVNRLNVDVTGIFSRRLLPPANDPNAMLYRVQVDGRITF
jgi:hypothetical protein